MRYVVYFEQKSVSLRMQKYSLGIQDFSVLRENGCVYVDKTELIYQLIQGKCYFLSHPRRFGKSLLLSTLKYLFEGRQELFEGLWIQDKIDWAEMQHPILHFSFIESGFHSIGFEKYLHIKLDEQAKSHQVTLQNTDISNKMRELVLALHQKHGKSVVLLVDEYDKPITEFLRKDQIHTAEENRELMRQFYSPLKDLDRHLRFIFLTGVSKFSKVSIFSDLNHLEDITVDRRFSTLLGYTETEITHYFAERIQEVAEYQELTYEACFEKMRLWYDGYSWHRGKNKVYNPTSVLKFLATMEFKNFWFETGSPTFLIDMMSEKFTYNVENLDVTENLLNNFKLEDLDDITLLFQTGYLTIKDENDGIYTLTYPNQEVRDSMLQYLLSKYSHKRNVKPIVRDMSLALAKRDFEKVFDILNGMLGEIPHQIFDAKQEKYYHAVIFLTFRLLGYYAQAEPSVGKGRIDAVVETADGIFIFEFKVNGTIEEAMAQIHKNKYYQRYLASEKEIYLLAIVCQDKELKAYHVEKFEK
ncbi:MAG: AAA family ATPase [Bacteroidetes bacterium]|nr:MAG: AAA family ATPase [Bacteroidota bacterium]